MVVMMEGDREIMSSATYDSEQDTERDLERLRKADGYTLNHLAVHLHQAGLRDRLYRLLIGNKGWMTAKFIRLGSDAPYAADLDLALGDFSDPIDPANLVTLVQLTAAIPKPQ